MAKPGESEHSDSSRALHASKVTLPKLDPAPTHVLAFLQGRFPYVADWGSRMARGLVREDGGGALAVAAPYRAGLRILYFREVEAEPEIPCDAGIIFQDAHLLVADKPHFLPVTPSGPYVRTSLLARLQEQTGIETLAPLHRLDRETAGLVLFSVQRESRAAYSELFQKGRIRKTYHAVAPMEAGSSLQDWRVENRIEKGEPFFRMACVKGLANARSSIRLLGERYGYGLFEIAPETGKKHQIRLHMAAIGHPILHDKLYPELQPEAPSDVPPDYSQPLQLLAKRLEFSDPITGDMRIFESGQELAWNPLRS
jgi:tRNA pseudouridine32 synthase/23S rRNA pseudouridine746 synthase